jgi:hypothetical protein
MEVMYIFFLICLFVVFLFLTVVTVGMSIVDIIAYLRKEESEFPVLSVLMSVVCVFLLSYMIITLIAVSGGIK